MQIAKFFSRFIFLSTLLSFLPIPLTQSAEAGVAFKHPIEMAGTHGKPFDQDMKKLLKDPGVPPYQFSSPDLPSWLKIEGDFLRGNPPSPGLVKFRLTVKDSTPEGMDFNHPASINVLPPPPQFKVADIDLGTQKEDSAWNDNLKNYLVDGSLVTSFSATGLPGWISLNTQTGELSGTPRRADVGNYSGITFKATGLGGEATAAAHGVVLKTIHPPVWTKNPITYPDTLEDQAFSGATMPFVSKGDGVNFNFTLSGAPAWLSVNSSTGELSGTPHTFGPVAFSITLKTKIDGLDFTDTTQVKFTILHVNHAPKWSENPITLANAFHGVTYSQNISGKASDPDAGDTLSFSLTGPAWASIDPQTGVLSGTPTKAHLGLNTFQAKVTDQDGASATTTVRITVIKSNEPPVWTNHPTILPDAKEDFSYSAKLSNYASDPDSDPLFFTVLSGPAWLSLDANGNLVGTPGASDLGIAQLSIRVSDHKSQPDDTSDVKVLVIHTNHAPKWTMNPIKLQTDEEVLFTSDLSVYAQDVDAGDTLSFAMVSGPSWAKVDSKGVFSGTAQMEHEGENHFVVRVTDNVGASADTKVTVNVLHVNHAPFWTKNPIVLPNAKDDAAYSSAISPFAKDVDPGDVLRFVKVSNVPAWVKISATGEVTGSPSPSDVGFHSFQAKVTDLANAEAVVTVEITVDHVNHAPKWSGNPLTLPNAFHGVAFTQNIFGEASDQDGGDTLTFSLSGPGWATLDSKTGVFSGTPTKANLGLNKWQATVTDQHGASATTTVQVTVIKSNEPPVWTNHPTILPGAKEDFAFSVNLNPHASDPDSDPMFFTIVSGPSWGSIDSSGNFVGTPKAGDVGTSKFTIKVSDHKSTPDDVSEVHVLVEHTNHAPLWTKDPITLQTPEDVLFTSNISGFAKDVDVGDTLTFSMVSGPSWGSLSTAGVFSGTAHIENEGENNFVVRVTDNSGASADVRLVINVLHVNHAPFWTQNPIVLPNAKDDVAYSSSITAFAKDIDPGDVLRFVKISNAPAWVKISATGEVTGSPTPADLGLHSFQAKVLDLANAEAVVTVQITVDHVNHSPKWSENPINLANAFHGVAYSQNIFGKASDPDAGDTLSFSMTGPAWASLDPKTGVFSGTPAKADVGPNSWQATVKDQHGAVATTTVQVTVVKSNEPPIWTNHPTLLPDAKEDLGYSVKLSNYATDPDSDPLFFTILSGPSWLNLDANGNLSGTPGASDLGIAQLSVRVSDHKSQPDDTTDVKILVIHTNHAPKWTMNPIKLQTNIEVLFTSDISVYAQDVDAGDTLSFAMVSGPAWAKIDSKGVLSGTAQMENEGENKFVVRVTDNNGASADTNVTVNVLHVNHPPTWTQNPIVLPNGKDDAPYTPVSLSSYAKDQDPGDVLKFAKVSSTPAWVKISSSGEVTGTPSVSDVGLHSFQVKVSDSSDAEALVTVQVTIDHVNHPPQWSMNPVVLPNAQNGTPVSHGLSIHASDPDLGDILTYSLSGPAWAKIDPKTGVFSGTPSKFDIGLNTFQATVTDPYNESASTTVQVSVVKANEPPVWVNHPTLLMDGKEDFAYSVALPGYAIDPDSDPLFFTIVSGPAWAKIDGSGNLVGTPKATDVGISKFSIKVSDHKSTPDDVSEVHILVLHTNHPPTWVMNPILFTGYSDVAFSGNTSPFAKDPDAQDTLTFTLVSGPGWAQLSSDGILSGTPQVSDEGSNTFMVQVADNSGSTATVNVIVNVEHTNHAPYWTQDPIILPNAKEGSTYVADISSYAKDPDAGDILKFNKASSTMAWLSVGNTGSVSGMPAMKDVGTHTFKAEVSDPAGLKSIATFQITVDRVNHPPVWSKDPIIMTAGKVDLAYSFNLVPFASDPDEDALTFKLLSGPDWMNVSGEGMVGGTPVGNSNAGSFKAMFQVTDIHGASAVTNGTVVIVETNHPPVISANLPSFVVKERELFSAELSEWVTDPDNEPLFFKLIDVKDWTKLSAQGTLKLNPQRKDIASYELAFTVSDGNLLTKGTLKIEVIKDPRPPVWTSEPIGVVSLLPTKSLSLSVKDKAMDPDNEPLTFSKKSGPDWLSFSDQGVLTGTATSANIGENRFTLSACNVSLLCAHGTFIVNVTPEVPVTDVVQVDTAVPGASSENLWVIDNPGSCSPTVTALKKNIHYYYNRLNQAQIHHSGIYLSANAKEFDGVPIEGSSGSMLMLWTSPNVVQDFLSRLNISETNLDARCNHCSNSPIWSMYRFYTHAPDISEIWHNGYFVAQNPMDVMVVSDRRDSYSKFAKSVPETAKWTAKDFAKDFVDFHKETSQSYRISAIAPLCLQTDRETEHPYRALTEVTKGVYYEDNCKLDMKKAIEDYANRVVFRAYVHAKKEIALSKTPKDPKKITVRLAGTILPGNTGLESDKWSYNAAKNHIEVYWHLIDDSKLKPGDKIEVEYLAAQQMAWLTR
jgi:hypothetical protein